MIFKWGKCECGKKFMVSKPRKCSCGNDLTLSDEWSVRYTHKGKTVTKTISTRKRDAEDYLANIRVNVRAGGLLPGEEKDITWEEADKAFREWFDMNTIRLNTKKMYASCLNNMSAYFRGYTLQELDAAIVSKYLQQLVAEGKAPATVNRYLSTIKRMLSLHCQWNTASKTPRLHLANQDMDKVKPLPENNIKTRFLTECEARTLLLSCNQMLKVIVTVALYTGLRLRNILDLTWDQIGKDTITFEAGEMKGGEHFTLPLHPQLSIELKRWKLARGSVSKHVFEGKQGNAITSIQKRFEEARNAAGLQDITFHTLRHTFASNFIINGGDITTLSHLLDHSDVSITSKRYVHLTQEHKREQLMQYGMTL